MDTFQEFTLLNQLWEKARLPGKSGEWACLARHYQGKRVFVTGHTGFKGSWLCEWLLELGAEVTGYSLPPPTEPALFDQLGLARGCGIIIGDIRDPAALQRAMREARPDFVFHLAAQPLVASPTPARWKPSRPTCMGTVHLLEALRLLAHPAPPSSSPRTNATRTGSGSTATARKTRWAATTPTAPARPPPNRHRLVSPLLFQHAPGEDRQRPRRQRHRRRRLGARPHRARLHARAADGISRSPCATRGATRPWQHVLEPLSGYLWLAACLSEVRSQRSETEVRVDVRSQSQKSDSASRSPFRLRSDSLRLRSSSSRPLSSDWLPPSTSAPGMSRTGRWQELVTEVLKHWPGRWEDRSDPNAVHEANLLQLATDKAHALLDWAPVWTFPRLSSRRCSGIAKPPARPQSASALTTAADSTLLRRRRPGRLALGGLIAQLPPVLP